ncbi:MAG: ATP-binding protein [Candidatus Omnitrophota bacterium]
MAPIIIYIVTIVTSAAIAGFLIRMTTMSYYAKLKEDERKKNDFFARDDVTDHELKEYVNSEIQNIVGSEKRSREISKVVSDIMSKEVNKKVEQASQQIGERYNKVIEQKIQNEEIAWKKYKKVLSNKKETEAVIRSVAEGLVVADSKGRVIMMNPAAEKLLGVSKKDKIGKHILDNLQKGELVTLAKGTPEKDNMTIEARSQEDETRKILRSSSAVIEDENGQTVGMVSVLSDITKQRELDQMKSRFVSGVTHELRTPLVSAQKSISLILSRAAGKVSEAQQQFLSNAERNLNKLSGLIDDLLDMSKLEAGKLEIKLEPQTVEKIINESTEGLNAWAVSKSIDIIEDIQEGLPNVNVDMHRINHVLNNLIGNALKFTPSKGKITVKAALDKEGSVEISVSDTGIGIPEAALPKVFDRFYQAGERVATDVSGTGIGLSVAKEVVELHGGKIWVESQKGEGATFNFTLSPAA